MGASRPRAIEGRCLKVNSSIGKAGEAESRKGASVLDILAGATPLRLTAHYVFALLLLAIAAVGAHAVLVYSLSGLEEESAVINTSGRQRMLSEQTFRLAGELMVAQDPAETRELNAALQSSLDLMRTSHEQHAGHVRQSDGASRWDQDLRAAYFGGDPSLDTRLRAYFAALETIRTTPADDPGAKADAYRMVVAAHREGLLRDLDQVVGIEEHKAQARLRGSVDLHLYLIVGMLALLLVDALFIFRPLIRRQLQANRDLLEARDQAQAELAARTNVLAAVSHEIRTPLGGVLGIIDQLKRERSSFERERAMVLMEDSCQALLDTLDAILRQTALGRGDGALLERTFSPRGLAQRVAELFRPVARRKALTIEVNATTDRKARGDDARLQQVLSNLVSNSVKFTQSGAITIFVQEPSPDTGEWTFTVCDTGSGMSESRLQGLFKPFGHSSADTLGRRGGAGLGLSITRDLVDAMGGRIEVESELGKGSSFTVRVPLDDPPEPVGPAEAPVNGGCVALLIRRASDRVQAEAIAEHSGYTVYDLRGPIEADWAVDRDLTVIADAALLRELGDEVIAASRQIIILGDEHGSDERLSEGKAVFVSHSQLARSLSDILERQAP